MVAVNHSAMKLNFSGKMNFYQSPRLYLSLGHDAGASDAYVSANVPSGKLDPSEKRAVTPTAFGIRFSLLPVGTCIGILPPFFPCSAESS